MELKCTINNVEYALEQGATFTDNYNETLDSGVISIVHVNKIEDLQPYNDVFIYDIDFDFLGYRVKGQESSGLAANEIYRVYFTNKNGVNVHISQTFSVSPTNNKDITYSLVYEDENGNEIEPFFFKHLLVDSFQETQMRIGNPIYNYSIDLCSEISKMEKISTPNISITRNFAFPRSCWFYLQQYVKLYSPKIKMTASTSQDAPSNRTWKYEQKYHLDPSLEYIFDNVTCPEMSWSNPSLRDILSQIMIVKDMIPYVENDVIRGLDITKTHGVFQMNNPSCSYIYGGMSSSDFATDARREYGGAISNDNSARLTEFLGFRVPNSGIMSLYNMTLETRYPIYKVNRLYMCYYKKIKVNDEYKYFLCKQDITRSVLLDTVRNTLKSDWTNFNDLMDDISTDFDIDNYLQYQYATVGYSIGSNKISGWGTYYEYPVGWWFTEGKTYIENLVKVMGAKYPFGIYKKSDYGILETSNIELDEDENKNIVAYLPSGENQYEESANVSDRLKSIFFEMDYIAMFSGAVIHSKDNATQDDIITPDNCSAALSILETDGLFEKEKMNRLGNKNLRFPTRYAGTDGYWQMQNYNHVLGSILDDGSIVYSREYSIYNQEVKGSISACYEYVMKNYFTSVWAKYRTYSLMPYNESIVRAENVREIILLSKTKSYYEESDIQFDKTLLLSAFSESTIKNNIALYENRINTAKIEIGDNTFYSDFNGFVCGYSLCFNARTYDNASAGDYIDNIRDEEANEEVHDVVTEVTTQSWYQMSSDTQDNFIQSMTFTFCHIDFDALFAGSSSGLYPRALLNENAAKDLIPAYYQASYKLPREPETLGCIPTREITGTFDICKDNKEIIDMTYQFEYKADDDILISPYLSKLNDLISTEDFLRLDEDYQIRSITQNGIEFWIKAYNLTPYVNSPISIRLRIPKTYIDNQQYISDKVISCDSIFVARTEDDYDGTDINVVDGRLYLKEIESYEIEPIWGHILYVNAVLNIKSHKVGYYNDENRNIRLAFSLLNSETDNNYYYFRCTTYSNTVNNIGYQRLDYLRIVRFNIPISYVWLNGQGSEERNNEASWGDFNNKNSLVFFGNFYQGSDFTQLFTKNMFVGISENKLDKYLVQDDFALEDAVEEQIGACLCRNSNGNHILLRDAETLLYISAANFFETVTLEDGRNVLRVLVSRIPILRDTAKSIQYWWKDKNGRMHLVFGVNFDNVEDIDIYLSVIKQRSLKVYNKNHKYIGENTNYNQTETYEQSEEEQYFSDGSVTNQVVYVEDNVSINVHYVNNEDITDTGAVKEYSIKR